MTKHSYEVQLRRAGRWTIAQILEERAAAERTADTLLKQHDVDAVRVVRDLDRGDGMHSEIEILRKERPRAAMDTAGPRLLAREVESAPPCERAADLLQQAARVTLGRVLRAYCDKETVTATELLTSHQLIKRVMAQPDLVGGAVDRVVRAQRQHCDDDPKTLADRLYALIDQVARRAKHAYALPAVQAFTPGGFSALLAGLLDRHSQEKSEYLALAALSRRTLCARGWLGKLDVICGEADPSDPEALALLDAALADVLAGPGAIQDIVGDQKSLAAVLRVLIEFRAGAWGGHHAATAKLAALFRQGMLEQTRSALLAACVARLAGAKPLDGGEPAREGAALHALLDRALEEKGLVGGGAIAEAAVLRAGRWGVHGGATGRAEALDLILSGLAAPWRRVLFLTELAGSPLAEEQAGPIEAGLRAALRCGDIDELLPGQPSGGMTKMQALVAMHTRIDESLLRDGVRAHCLDRLDMLLANHVVRARVIESIDDPGSDLHTRATRLVRFCQSVTPGRAQKLARERVVQLLRQPSFEERLVAHLPAAERERALRDFDRLLAMAGFRGP